MPELSSVGKINWSVLFSNSGWLKTVAIIFGYFDLEDLDLMVSLFNPIVITAHINFPFYFLDLLDRIHAVVFCLFVSHQSICLFKILYHGILNESKNPLLSKSSTHACGR